MNAQLNHILARHRAAELQRAGEQARLAREVRMRGHKSRHRSLITRLRARPARVLGTLILPAMLAALVFGAPAAMGDPVGQISEFSIGPNTMPGPAYIAPGADGNLWFTEPYTQKLGRITPSGQITEYSNGLGPGSVPDGITPGPDGNMWFTDAGLLAGGTSGIGWITPSGQISEYAAGLNQIIFPFAIAPGADGNMWFTDARVVVAGETSAIGRITPSGQITEYSAGLKPGSGPQGIAPGPDGNLWFTDAGARRDWADHPVGADHRVLRRPRAGQRAGGDRARTRRQPVVHRRRRDPRDRANHPVGDDHGVHDRPGPAQHADRDRGRPRRQPVVHR